MREEIRALLSGEPKTDTAAVTAAFLSATDPARKRELLGLLRHGPSGLAPAERDARSGAS